jgi:glycosyltransferase involved in cell wall biosynthesis
MLVSVIIPCYNVSQYIGECIESVYNQTHKNLEVICVDNNSTDKTIETIQLLQLKYPSLVILNEPKEGANAARNCGLKIASGNWIQFLDADDLLFENKIENQLKLISKFENKNLGYVASAYIKRNINKIETKICTLDSEKYTAAFLNKSGNTCSNLWNKKIVLNVGMWNENIKSSQETELMLKMINFNYDFVLDTEALTIIRERESGQISQGKPDKKWQQFIEIRIEYLKFLKLNSISEYQKHKGILLDFLMNSIVTLSYFDKLQAVSYYDNFVKPNWEFNGTYGFNKLKFNLIKILGLDLFLKLNSIIK